jgi:hypothetical protein
MSRAKHSFEPKICARPTSLTCELEAQWLVTGDCRNFISALTLLQVLHKYISLMQRTNIKRMVMLLLYWISQQQASLGVLGSDLRVESVALGLKYDVS